MEGADALGLIAEIGIAIAGFAGVVATLRAPGGRIAPYAMFRIGALLFQSGGAVLLALLPFALYQAGLGDPGIWRLTSVVMLVLAAMLVVAPFTFGKGLIPPPGERAPGIQIMAPLQFAITGAIVILQVANVAMIGQLWPFYAGLLAITMMSLLNFGWILFAPGRSEMQA